jgi:hypothetical protein
MIGAHVYQSTELREAKLPLQMLMDVLSYPPESVWRQVAAILHGVQRSAPRTASSSA